MGLDLLFHDSRHTRQLVSFQKQTDSQTQRTHSRAISRKRTHLLEGLKKDRKILCHNHRSARYFGWLKLDILAPGCVCKIFYGKIFWDTVDKPTSTGMSEPFTLAVRGSPVSPCSIRQHTSAHASVVRSPSGTVRMVFGHCCSIPCKGRRAEVAVHHSTWSSFYHHLPRGIDTEFQSEHSRELLVHREIQRRRSLDQYLGSGMQHRYPENLCMRYEYVCVNNCSECGRNSAGALVRCVCGVCVCVSLIAF
jgi:hypothetical protein